MKKYSCALWLISSLVFKYSWIDNMLENNVWNFLSGLFLAMNLDCFLELVGNRSFFRAFVILSFLLFSFGLEESVVSELLWKFSEMFNSSKSSFWPGKWVESPCPFLAFEIKEGSNDFALLWICSSLSSSLDLLASWNDCSACLDLNLLMRVFGIKLILLWFVIFNFSSDAI